MDLISVLIILIVVGAILYLVEHTLPLDPSIRLVIRVLVLIVVLLWILRMFLGGSIPILGPR